MRGLIYPLTGIVVLAVAALLVAAATAQVTTWREHRAIRHARWEVFTDSTDGRRAEVGIRKIARWGTHEKILAGDPAPDKVYLDNYMELFDAQNRAQARADLANSLLHENK